VLGGGVDEAGGGPATGPLGIAGVCLAPGREPRLGRLGVRSSKYLSAARREELYGEVIDAAESYRVSRVSPGVIDSRVRRHELNELEAERMARIISALMPAKAYVDACDVNEERFGRAISDRLSGGCAARIVSRHRADEKYLAVSAASIVAKVRRDRAISRIRRHHGVGSGYPSDRRCVEFLASHACQNAEPPDFARATWLTVRRIYGLPAPAPARTRGRGRTARGPSTGPRQSLLQFSRPPRR